VLVCVGLCWVVLGCVGLCCVGLCWVVLGCVGLGRVLCWVVLGCVGLGWVVLGCVGLCWAVLRWVVLGCVVLCSDGLGCSPGFRWVACCVLGQGGSSETIRASGGIDMNIKCNPHRK